MDTPRYRYNAWLADGSKLTVSFDADRVHEEAQQASRDRQECVDVTAWQGGNAAGEVCGHWRPRGKGEYSEWVDGRLAAEPHPK